MGTHSQINEYANPTYKDLYELYKECVIVQIFENKRLQKRIHEMESERNGIKK